MQIIKAYFYYLHGSKGSLLVNPQMEEVSERKPLLPESMHYK